MKQVPSVILDKSISRMFLVQQPDRRMVSNIRILPFLNFCLNKEEKTHAHFCLSGSDLLISASSINLDSESNFHNQKSREGESL